MNKSEAYEKWMEAVNAVPNENTAIKAWEDLGMYVLETYTHGVERQEFKYDDGAMTVQCRCCGKLFKTNVVRNRCNSCH